MVDGAATTWNGCNSEPARGEPHGWSLPDWHGLRQNGQPDHPTVLAAVKSAEEYVRRDNAEIEKDELCIYHLGVAGIFLADLDPVRHRPTILRILELLRNLQRPHGGWGYPYSQVGDTSMTQYAVLCLWTADRSNSPDPARERYAGGGLADANAGPERRLGLPGKRPWQLQSCRTERDPSFARGRGLGQPVRVLRFDERGTPVPRAQPRNTSCRKHWSK